MKTSFHFITIALLFILISTHAFGQKSPIEFGRFNETEVKMKSYSKDSSAHAVVLCDYGVNNFRYVESEGDFTFAYKRHTRIKIFDKEAYDLANFKVLVYNSSYGKDKFTDFKAVSYNVNNGKLEETKIDKDDLFTERKNKHWEYYKFSLPNVKEGTIIEIQYTIKSNYAYSIRDWYFQAEVPTIWSEYYIEYPQGYHYNFTQKGYESLAVNEQGSRKQAITLTYQRGGADGFDPSAKTKRQESVNFNVITQRWAAENVPAFKSEAYISNVENYLTAMELELAYINLLNFPSRSYAQNWDDINRRLLESSWFGQQLDNTKFIRGKVKELTASATTDKEKATAIHNFVKQHMKWDGIDDKYIDNSLKKAYNSKVGNSADINLLLTIMLREAGLKAYPVVLSTRDNGMILPVHPSMGKLNYVVAAAKLDDKYILMDATDPYLPLTLIPKKCINGSGKMITKGGIQNVNLMSVGKNKRAIQLTLSLNEDKQMIGTLKGLYKEYAAINIRASYFGTEKEESFLDEIQAEYSGLTINDKTIENIDNPYKPINVKYDVTIDDKVDKSSDLLYFNPMLFFGIENNPFKIEERSYPVDFNYPTDQVYALKFTIPEGYEVDEIPAKTVISMENNAAKFTFHAIVNEGVIGITSIVKINNTIFVPEQYGNLKEFFNMIAKKHAEQIVLKKKT